MTQNDTAATLSWYDREASSPPFDPDGMCLKICRTARNIGAVFPSAIAAQEATPREHRVMNIADIRQGMVMYFDDPKDSNPFGHIVTVVGRARGEDRSKLRSIIVWTNSVKSNELVKVRADYFPVHWGDQFQFAATWLNGVELDLPELPRTEQPKPRMPRVEEAIEAIERSLAFHQKRGHTRLVRALKRDLAELRETLSSR